MTADSGAGAKAPEGEDEIARLLAVPLGDFVEERKRLAASLKSLGRRDEAQAIAKLAKPSAALWAINQLARREPAAIRRLAELTAVMQAGPRHAPDEYAQRLAEHRDVLRALRAAAEGILAEAKIGVSPALLERILHTLRAGMADDETRAAIEKARLLARGRRARLHQPAQRATGRGGGRAARTLATTGAQDRDAKDAADTARSDRRRRAARGEGAGVRSGGAGARGRAGAGARASRGGEGSGAGARKG